jgi:chromosome segregation ATPase
LDPLDDDRDWNAEAFEEINRHFAGIFQRLFEGGRAELRMVPPEEDVVDLD